jgi:hypothetical protein
VNLFLAVYFHAEVADLNGFGLAAGALGIAFMPRDKGGKG